MKITLCIGGKIEPFNWINIVKILNPNLYFGNRLVGVYLMNLPAARNQNLLTQVIKSHELDILFETSRRNFLSSGNSVHI